MRLLLLLVVMCLFFVSIFCHKGKVPDSKPRQEHSHTVQGNPEQESSKRKQNHGQKNSDGKNENTSTPGAQKAEQGKVKRIKHPEQHVEKKTKTHLDNKMPDLSTKPKEHPGNKEKDNDKKSVSRDVPVGSHINAAEDTKAQPKVDKAGKHTHSHDTRKQQKLEVNRVADKKVLTSADQTTSDTKKASLKHIPDSVPEEKSNDKLNAKTTMNKRKEDRVSGGKNKVTEPAQTSKIKETEKTDLDQRHKNEIRSTNENSTKKLQPKANDMIQTNTSKTETFEKQSITKQRHKFAGFTTSKCKQKDAAKCNRWDHLRLVTDEKLYFGNASDTVKVRITSDKVVNDSKKDTTLQSSLQAHQLQRNNNNTEVSKMIGTAKNAPLCSLCKISYPSSHVAPECSAFMYMCDILLSRETYSFSEEPSLPDVGESHFLSKKMEDKEEETVTGEDIAVMEEVSGVSEEEREEDATKGDNVGDEKYIKDVINEEEDDEDEENGKAEKEDETAEGENKEKIDEEQENSKQKNKRNNDDENETEDVSETEEEEAGIEREQQNDDDGRETRDDSSSSEDAVVKEINENQDSMDEDEGSSKQTEETKTTDINEDGNVSEEDTNEIHLNTQRSNENIVDNSEDESSETDSEKLTEDQNGKESAPEHFSEDFENSEDDSETNDPELDKKYSSPSSTLKSDATLEKLKDMNAQILRLENQFLGKALEEENMQVEKTKLENQILKLENTLLLLNQSFNTLRADSETMKSQIKNQEMSQTEQVSKELAVKDNALSVNVQLQIIDLNRIIRKQSWVLERLKRKWRKQESQDIKLQNLQFQQRRMLHNLMQRMDALEASRKDESKTVSEENRPVRYSSTSPRDCYDLYLAGEKKDGVYKFELNGSQDAMEAYCDMGSGGWTVVLRRSTGDEDFFRTWNDYKRGFGDPEGDHWLGNDAIHQLTNHRPYKLYIDMMDWEGNQAHAEYSHFQLEAEDQGYRLRVMGYRGTAGDALSKHNNQMFSTKDVDNDEVEKTYGGSCARRFNGAWWYYKCYKANLNGVYYVGGEVPGNRFDGIAWKPWKGINYSLKKVIMRIKPYA
ncbi:protein scabrous [Lingula anatina]|uniref:Protein scabrous n=1 Tax=Lingula anatina TaxID=7574 RepID=A0A1S3IDP9_LINAN|nr:protein scabrous [Lingula anatina]XP_013396283.1 protein scabrous [Lingula anatina]|eukprot:XP_013396281.1 protein scabrous [Lingula anatina]